MESLYSVYKFVKHGSKAFVIGTIVLTIILTIMLILNWDRGWTTGRKMSVVIILLGVFMLYRWRNILMLIINPEVVIVEKVTEQVIEPVTTAIAAVAEEL